MDRKKKKDSSGLYIAICCAVLVVAASGFISRLSMEDKSDVAKTAESTKTPIPTLSPTKPPKVVEKNDDEVPLIVSNNVTVEEDVEFEAPVSGKIIEEFSGENLVYNESLKDWRAHSGVDFEAKIGEKVLAGANGVIENVFDSNMGRCVIIDHLNGYKTMYANLEENTPVKVGDEVACGDVIGAVGDTALGDITDAEHVHFEILEDEKNVNPEKFLK